VAARIATRRVASRIESDAALLLAVFCATLFAGAAL